MPYIRPYWSHIMSCCSRCECAKVCIFRYDGLLSANSLVLEVSLYREIAVDQRLFPVMRKSELAEEKVWKRYIVNTRAEYDILIRFFPGIYIIINQWRMCVENSLDKFKPLATFVGYVIVVGGNREFRRHCQDKGITNFYIRLSPISEQVGTKVITHTGQVTRATHVMNRVCPRVESILSLLYC